MDRFEAMTVLVAAVESGSFSAASRKLNMPLPTVSRKVKDLEDHLSVQLLVRTTRSLELTEAGAAYLAACKTILDQVGEAERAASGEYNTPRGNLLVTAPIVFGRLHILPLVTEFMAQHPQVSVKMVFSDRNLHLTDEHIDVALRVGTLPDSSMIAKQVGVVSRVFCGSPAYFAGRGTPRKPADLAGHSMVCFDGLAAGPSWTFGGTSRHPSEEVDVAPRLVVNTAEAALDAAINGVGITQLLSYQVEQAVKEGLLNLILINYQRPPLPVSLVQPGQGILPLKTRRFLEFAAPRLRAALSNPLHKGPADA